MESTVSRTLHYSAEVLTRPYLLYPNRIIFRRNYIITSAPKYSRLTAASTVILVEANALVLDESGISALFVNGVFGAGVGCITESHC